MKKSHLTQATHSQLALVIERDNRIRFYLDLESWTPPMGALLVSGILPPKNCTAIPNEGVNLLNKPLHGGSANFHLARKILSYWQDHCEDQEADRIAGSAEAATGAKAIATALQPVNPYEFLNWCIDCEFESDWLRLFRYLTFAAPPDYIDALPSPISVILDQALAQSTLGAASAEVETDRTRLKRHLLHQVRGGMDVPIIEAKIKAKYPDLYPDVWEELKFDALSSKPTRPITGYNGKMQAVEYLDDSGKTAYFYKDSLRKRMDPNAR